MATDLEELKHEVESLRAITQDTNRQVHKLRRAAWWGRLWSVVWWLTIFGVSSAAYYYYLQPYVQKVENLYLGAQHSASQAQSFEQQAAQYFNGLFGGSTTTKP
jgi:hypothetical protein